MLSGSQERPNKYNFKETRKNQTEQQESSHDLDKDLLMRNETPDGRGSNTKIHVDDDLIIVISDIPETPIGDWYKKHENVIKDVDLMIINVSSSYSWRDYKIFLGTALTLTLGVVSSVIGSTLFEWFKSP